MPQRGPDAAPAAPGTETAKSRGQWSSEPAFVFAMAAAAVGLGNLWRFPYLVGEYGGGGFILAYLLALVIICLPLMYLEVAAGRFAQGNTVHTFRQVHRRFGAGYGWFVVAITAVITSYYLVVTGWTLGYAADAWRDDVRVFAEFSGGYASLYLFIAVLILAALLLLRGVNAIEGFSKLLMPVLLALVVGLVVMASRTAGWDEAKQFLLSADFAAWRDPELWTIAFGQGFYSLAIGQGYLVTYGSYIPRKAHVPRACVIVGVTETSVALLAGWMIFPFVFTHDLDPAAGTQLAFSTLPRVFENAAWGVPLAIAFFGLFFLAAFSSCLAGLKVIISAVAEEFRIANHKAVLFTAVVMLSLGIPSALSFTPVGTSIGGTPFLEWVDKYAGGQLILFSGIVGAGLFCWLVKPERLVSAIGSTSRWWTWRIYFVGRWLPFAVALWLLISFLF